MKWIGQHIWDFISRFRSDVYLEAIESGTIASGGNLGLDSNNKIVKADTEAGELSITNASDNRVVTSSGGTDLNAEANLTFDGTTLTSQATLNTFTHSTTGQIEIINTGNNTTAGLLKLTNNRGQVGVDGDTVGKIQFRGNDDDGGSGNMTQYAEIEVESSETANGAERGRVYVKVATPTEREGLNLHATADNVIDASIGYGTTSTTTIAGDLNPSGRIRRTLKITDGAAAGEYDGDVVYTGTTTGMDAGDVYYYNSSGTWTKTNASTPATSTGLLAVALGDESDVDGMLLRGMATTGPIAGSPDEGAIVYLRASAGDITTDPASSGQVNRIVGYCMENSNNRIYFDPDKSWVELA